MSIGLWLGNHVHLGLTAEHMQRVIGILLIVSGVSLLVRAGM